MLRRMREQDLEAVAKLEQVCFSDPWSPALLQRLLESPLDVVWVLEEVEEVVAGYCNLRVVACEGELMRIAVHPGYQGRGIGKKLMEALAVFAREQGIREITLEVRAGNERAINLYKSWGFLSEAVRQGYYENPKEDALIMWNHCV